MLSKAQMKNTENFRKYTKHNLKLKNKLVTQCNYINLIHKEGNTTGTICY